MTNATGKGKSAISRRNFLGQVAAASALSACSGVGKPDVPDVVLIIIDTLRADKLYAERNYVPLMPNLQTLAESSVNFTQAYSPETFTKPSVTSILTSLYPEVHGVNFGIWTPAQVGKGDSLKKEVHVDVLTPELPYLPSMMKAAGYTTIGYQTNMQLHAESGFTRDFDQYHYFFEDNAASITSKAVSSLQNARGPVFLYVHYMDPHLPYNPPKDVVAAFGSPPRVDSKDMAILKSYNSYYTDLVAYGFGLSAERQTEPLSSKGREFVRYMYDGDVRFIDREIASLIDAARKRNPESLIVITSDHGEEFWEHGSVGHTKTAYRELAHVPLIIASGSLDARKIDSPVENLGILPTIASFLGLSIPDGCQGDSLMPFLSGELPDTTNAAFTSASGVQPWDKIKWQSVCADGYRLVKNLSLHTTELFNIQSDPKEQESLTEKEPELVAALEKTLETHLAANMNHPMRQKTQVKVEVSDEDLEALRALGYIR
jgi:arylsulfatase A-like enzyme